MNQRNRAYPKMVLVGCAICLLTSLQQSAGQDNDAAIQKRITNTVLERGVVEAQETIDVRNRVRGKSTVLFMIPDGANVKKGDVLVSLDDSVPRRETISEANGRIQFRSDAPRAAERRKYEQTDEFRDRYRWRAGIEGARHSCPSFIVGGTLRVP